MVYSLSFCKNLLYFFNARIAKIKPITHIAIHDIAVPDQPNTLDTAGIP
jgi:hypothetical protein